MTTEAPQSFGEEQVYLPEGEPMGIEDIRDALVIREGDTFLLTDPAGNVPRGNVQGLGLYHRDTRHLSTYSLSFVDAAPVLLLSTAELGFSQEQVLTNPKMTRDGHVLGRGAIEVRRQRVIADLLEETVRITNFSPWPVNLELRYDFDADFADIFEVRGHEPEHRGKLLPTKVRRTSIVYAYEGADGRLRETRLDFQPAPSAISASGALFQVALSPRESAGWRVTISPHAGARARARTASRFDLVAASYDRWMEGATRVFSDNEFFNRVLSRSLADLRMLWSEVDERHRYPAAGTPWFDALFGRDSCIISLQTLPFRPEIARHCLRLLAHWQGTRIDPWRDEQPGKILHEKRFDELSLVQELPYSPYYGSVDSTPLFLLLAGEYYRWTADLRLLRELLPQLLAALNWIDQYGDSNGDGYVDYEKRSARGLVNQGWKDSVDSIVHADGRLARPPIALVEVQGYVYAAKRRLAPVMDALGIHDLAATLRRQAVDLRERFNRDFWMPDEGFLALALDGEGAQCRTAASNPGHALWTGIVSRQRAGQVVDRLLAGDLFSGWGLRTLSANHPRFNPIGYHLGTVWPHDNAIAAMGFKIYGFEDEVNEVVTALFDSACAFPYYRLPELFGGESRSAHNAPVPYPVACRPQGWAAGAFLLLVQAMLGLKADAPDGRLAVVNPQLPYWLNTVQVRGLRVGRGSVDLAFRRRRIGTEVEILAARGGIEVVQNRRWTV